MRLYSINRFDAKDPCTMAKKNLHIQGSPGAFFEGGANQMTWSYQASGTLLIFSLCLKHREKDLLF